MIPLPELKSKSVLVALKREIVHRGIDKDLESLILLKHSNLVRLLDFAFFTLNDPVILRYEMHSALSLYDVVRKESFIKPAKTLKWIYQAASLAYYLALKGCFHSILCAQDCYLDAGSNIKFRGAWKSSWPSWRDDTLRHSFYWRFVAPESLIYQTQNDLSMMWNLGVFMWQLCTDCPVNSAPRFLGKQSCPNDLVLMGLTERSSSSEELDLSTSRINVPQCIRSTISSCVNLVPEERCLWSDVLNTCKRESTIASVGGVVKQIFPFL
ncbi:hypothetical protein COOONC_18784 [Cooperia oncophora]